ncbi:RNB domain-containing protein 3 [Elsinoe australis]|uniref:RNB domain-containing protein 3 n=1 Tax=Elsinoe australis TaxID=40998 RepID=A0A4U7AVX4_9PEZI|nr:RNB domain-containing protein 3 [Elsinoe australis]
MSPLRSSAGGANAHRNRSSSCKRGDADVPQFTIRKTTGNPSLDFDFKKRPARMNAGIRLELKDWHTTYGIHMQDELGDYLGSVDRTETPNSFSRVGGTQEVYNPDTYDNDTMEGMEAMPGLKELDALDPNHRILRPGDLVELPPLESSRDPVVAVFVRRLAAGSVMSQFFSSTGKWLHSPQAVVQFVVPNFVNPDLIEKFIPHLPNAVSKELEEQSAFFDLSVPRDLSAPVVSRLINFTKESQDIYRQNAVRLDSAHELLAHENDLKFGTLTQIGRKLLNRPADIAITPQEQFAVRLALLRAGFAFGFDNRHHRITGFVHIRSKAQVKMVANVREWIRQYRDEMACSKPGSDPLTLHFSSKGGRIIQTFARKARAVALESREDREPTFLGNVGPSKERNKITQKQGAIRYVRGREWNENEQEIIRFFEAWSCVGAFRRQPTIESQPPLLLQATGLYENYELREKTGFVFLQEIGVMVPYENRYRYDENLLIPAAQHSRPLEQLMSRLAAASTTDPMKMGLITEDTMKHLRHDWEDLPVFCVDKPGALEIDDGISIEPAQDGTNWIHVHIANPTAFMDKDSPVARMARHMTETIYMPERAYTMLPEWAAKQRFSLRRNRPCLTFSARLDSSGVMLEYNVRPGTVRNVQFIDPDEVNRALGLGRSEGQKRRALIVGGEPPPSQAVKKETKAEDLSPTMKEALGKLHGLAKQRFGVRSALSGISLAAVDQDVKVWDKYFHPGLSWSGPARTHVKRVFGDPVIQLMASDFSTDMDLAGKMDSNMMVRECMLLACEVGSKWCHDRDLPNIYRGSLPGVSGSKETAQQYYQRVLEPMMKQRGGAVPFHMLNAYLNRSNPSTLTLEPLQHEQLGLTHFSKVTSPLRRYGDMVTHWQIQAALLEEDRRGISLVGGKGRDALPFSRASLQQMMLTLRAREDRIKRAKMAGIHFWTSQLFFRAHYFNEMELPKTLTAYISQPSANPDWQVSIIKQFGVGARMKTPDWGVEVKLGDEWECEIDAVDVYVALLNLKPLRLISRAEDGTVD